MTKKKILLGLTTTPGSDWREKIKEINKFKIKEIALFPTFLNPEERKESYDLLEKTCVESIPHVHLRSEDMPIEELEYFVNKYKTQAFNIHSPREFPLNYDYSKFKNIIYLENANVIPTEEEINSPGNGLCIDFAHWESAEKKMKIERSKMLKELLNKFPVGCSHISGISDKLFNYGYCDPAYDIHTINKLGELDYIKKYIGHLPDLISIELENSLEEQLKVKEYLEKIISY